MRYLLVLMFFWILEIGWVSFQPPQRNGNIEGGHEYWLCRTETVEVCHVYNGDADGRLLRYQRFYPDESHAKWSQPEVLKGNSPHGHYVHDQKRKAELQEEFQDIERVYTMKLLVIWPQVVLLCGVTIVLWLKSLEPKKEVI